VREKDHLRAKELFIAQGFQQTLSDKGELMSLQSGLWHEERRLKIDLHWGIPPEQLNINASKIMDNLSKISISGMTIPAPTPEDSLIILCINATKHYWNQLLYPYCDIHEFLRSDIDLDWPHLLGRARTLRCQRAVKIALAIVRELYGTEGLPAAEIRLEPASDLIKRELLEQLFNEHAGQDDPTHEEDHHRYYFNSTSDYYAALIDGNLRRAVYKHGKYLRPNEIDRASVKLPRNLSFLYYLIRPIRVIFTLGSRLFGFGRRD
jgi:hypothetical protein